VGEHDDGAGMRRTGGRWTAVGRVSSPRSDPGETDHWGDVQSVIEVDADRFGPGALQGLTDFSHLEVVCAFHLMTERDDYRTPGHPRGRTELPAVGVFAERGPRHPNLLGVSVCQIVGVDGCRVTVRGLDAVDGAPVLDLRPVIRQFVPVAVRQPEWVDDLLAEYW